MSTSRPCPARYRQWLPACCSPSGLWLLVLLASYSAAGYAQPRNPSPAGPPLTGMVSTLAGAARQAGALDGAGAAARFRSPQGVAAGADGTLYVADTQNHVIRLVSPTGVVTTLAGTLGQKGHADGVGTDVRFNQPVGVALDAQGILYVADGGNHVLRRVSPDGHVTTVAGQPGRRGQQDGPAATARFDAPHGIAVGPDGTVYIADTYNHTIRQLLPNGTIVTLAGSPGQQGAADGPGAQARFFHPAGLAVDAVGTIYVADNGNHTVRKITPAGQVSTLAGSARKKGAADGVGPEARFDTPCGVAVDGQGHVYVADYVNSTVRCITPDGRVRTLAGHARGWGSQDGGGEQARFFFPFALALAADGTRLYVADTANTLLRVIQ